MSVDEILKSKKNEKSISLAYDLDKITTNENIMNHKADTVISYLVHKSIDTFRMMSIVSIILSVAGVIIQYFIWMETKDLTGWIFGCWLEICGGGIFYYYYTLMKNQIRDYNTTAEIKLNAKDISNQFLVCLKIMWILMALILICYISY